MPKVFLAEVRAKVGDGSDGHDECDRKESIAVPSSMKDVHG